MMTKGFPVIICRPLVALHSMRFGCQGRISCLADRVKYVNYRMAKIIPQPREVSGSVSFRKSDKGSSGNCVAYLLLYRPSS
jgi:hypothetical protein